MSNLDERFLDGPNVGYCSDSEGEEEPFTTNESDLPPPRQGVGPQTGPKGVMNDFRRHHEELRQQQHEKDLLIQEQVNRFTVAPHRTEAENEDADEENELQKLRLKRMEKMLQLKQGRIQELGDKYQFLNIIEGAGEDELVVIHIYRDDLDACKMLNDALIMLSADAEDSKFYKIKPTVLNTSDNFEQNALPTLQIYLNGSIVANFVRITDELPDEFDNKDIYHLIQKRDISMKLKSK